MTLFMMYALQPGGTCSKKLQGSMVVRFEIAGEIAALAGPVEDLALVCQHAAQTGMGAENM
jgi:hypothetical protein